MAKLSRVIVFVMAAVLLNRFISAEVFTALSQMEKLLSIELELSDALENYIQEEENRLQNLKIFSRQLQRTVQLAQKSGTKFIGHPVNSYLMIKRFARDWPTVEEIVSKENPQEGLLLDRFYAAKKTFPGENDLKGAIAAIKRLQDVYVLTPRDFSEGRFENSLSSAYMLGPMDTYVIGRASYQEDDFVGTREWMDETLRLMDLGVHNDSKYPNEIDVLDHLAFAEYKTKDLESAVKHETEVLAKDPTNERIRNNLIMFTEMLEKDSEKYEKLKLERKKKKEPPNYDFMGTKISQDILETFNWYVERDIYKRLCRGERLPKAPQNRKRLYCWYFTASPLCTIKRCAMERVFTNPDIVLLKGIISDNEIEEVRNISMPLLNRATVHNPITGRLETAHYRISKNCWLSGDEHGEVIQRVENKIAAMTKLNLATAEGFQVQNYGLAGHYDPHFDFSRNLSNSSLGKLGTGNRIATVLVYLSQVEAGGATVFPYIGARILPQKGDGVFWHNLRRSGKGDFRTRHAGCPVLTGVKWVANKWIHEYGNEFNRPCSLKPDE